jgi:hypothetical protein
MDPVTDQQEVTKPVETTTPAPVPTGPVPVNIDLFKTRTETGLSFPEIANTFTEKDRLIPLHPREDYWEPLQSKFKTRQDFDKAYDEAASSYDQMQEAIFRKNVLPVGGEAFGFGKKSPYFGSNFHQSLNQQADFYSPMAVKDYMNVETASQNASRKGYHIIPDYATDKDGNLKQIGERKVPGNVPKWSKMDGNFYVSKEDPASNSYVYKTFDDKVPHYNLERASIWGDQKLYGKSLLDIPLGFMSVATEDLLQSMGQSVRVLQDFAGYSSMKKEDYERFVRTDALTGMFDNMIQEMNSYKYNPSVEVSQEKFFGSGLHGFAYQLGVGIGYVVPQRVVSGTLFKAFPTISKEALRVVSSIIGTSQPVNQFLQSARQAGIDPENAATLSVMAMPAVFATEYMLDSKWLTKGLGENAHAEVTSALKDATKDFVETQGKDIKLASTKTGILKATFKKLMTDKSFTESLKEGGSKVVELVGSAAREGTQEGSEEIWYSMLERAWDTGFFHDLGIVDAPGKTVGEGLFGNDGLVSKKNLDRYWQNAVGGFVIGGMMDAMILNQKDHYRDYVMEDMILKGQTDKLLKFIKQDFETGKMGMSHKDVNGKTILSDKDGNPTGETFTVHADVNINNQTYFEKGKVLNNMNDLAYYQAVQTVAEKSEIIKRTGLDDPQLVREFSGQESLITDALGIYKQKEQTLAIIDQLKKSLPTLTPEDADAANVKIAQLTEAVEGKKTPEGTMVGGLNQLWDYYTKPVGTSPKSQAYIDNVKTGIANGVMWNEDAKKYEMNPDAFKNKKISLSQVRNINNYLEIYKQNRGKFYTNVNGEEVELTPEKLFGIETNLTETISKGLDEFFKSEDMGVKTESLTSARKGINDLLSMIEKTGIDQRTSDNITKNIIGLTDKFNSMTRSYFGDYNLDYTEPGTSVRDAINEKNDALMDGEKPVDISGQTTNFLDQLSAIDDHMSSLTKLNADKKLNIRTENYTETQDQAKLTKLLYETQRTLQRFDGSEITESLDVDGLISAYKQGHLNIDRFSKTGQYKEFNNHLNLVDRILDYSETMFKERKRNPDLNTTLSNDTQTKVKDGNVIPGNDIPIQYIQGLREKNASLKNDLEVLKKKANIETQDIAIAEVRVRKSNILQKAYLLNRAFIDAGDELKEISSKMRTLYDTYTKIMKNDQQIADADVINLSKVIIDIENWIHAKGISDPDFQKRIMTKVIFDSPAIGTEKVYRGIRDSELSVYVDADDSLVSTNAVSFETMDKDLRNDRSAFKSILHLKATNYFNSLFIIDSGTFYNHLSRLQTKYNIIPGVEQIESIRLLASGILLPYANDGKAQFLIRGKLGQSFDTRSSELSMGIVPFNSVSIDGSGGVGKSTVIAKFGIGMANAIMVSHPNILITAPTSGLLNNLDNAIKESSFPEKGRYTHAEFFEKLTTGELKPEKNSIIMIDESSRVNHAEMLLISNIAKDNNLTVVFLGDSVQATDLIDDFIPSVAFSQTMGIRASRVNTKYRAGVHSIGLVGDMVITSIRGRKTLPEIPFPPVQYNADHTKGVMYAANATDVITAWKTDVVKSDGKNRVLIFENKTQADAFIRDGLTDDIKAYKDNVRYVMSEKIPEKNDPGTVQGMEFEDVYVAINDTDSNAETMDQIYRRRILLTALTRAQSFLMIPTYADNVGFSRLAKTEDIYDQTETIKSGNSIRANEATDYLNKIIGNTTPTATVAGVSSTPKTVGEQLPATKDGEQIDPVARKFRQGEEVVSVISNAVVKIKNVNQTKDGEVVHVELSDGTILEGPSALTELDEKYTSSRIPVDQLTDMNIISQSLTAAETNNPEPVLFRRSATMYNSSKNLGQGDVVPILVNVAIGDTKIPTMSGPEFFKEHGKTKLLEGELNVVFHPKVDLYTRGSDKNYTIKTHYNVLALEDASGNIIGVIPAPDTKFEDYDPSGVRKEKEFSSQKQIDYSEGNRQANLSKIEFDKNTYPNQVEYHSFLINLYTDSYNLSKGQKTTIGKVNLTNTRGGSSQITQESLKNPTDLPSFISKMEDDGVRFEKVGDNYTVIQRNDNVTGELRWHLKGSRILSDDGNSPLSNTSIPIPVAPKRITITDKENWDKIHDTIKKEITTLREIATTAKSVDFHAALSRSIPMQTLKANVSKIYKSDQAHQNVRKEYHGLLSIENDRYGRASFLNINEATKKGVKYSVIVDRLEKAVNQLYADSGPLKIFMWYPITNTTGKAVLSNVDNLVTYVENIGYPSYYGSISQDKGASETIAPARPKKGSLGKSNKNKTNTLRESTTSNGEFGQVSSSNAIWKSSEEARSYVRSVLGESYVNEFLSSDPDMKGLYGYTYGFKMILKSQGDFITEQSFRHEPVHIIIDYLVDSKRQKQLLDAVRKHFGKDMSDFDAKEMLAQLHHEKTKFNVEYSGVSGIISRFLNWLGQFWSSMVDYRHTLNTFFNDIESGKFVDKLHPSEINEILIMQGLDNEDGDLANISEAEKKINSKYNQLGPEFGGYERLQDVTNRLLEKVIDNTAANNYLDSTTNGFVTAIGATKSDLFDNQKNLFHDLTLLFHNVSANDVVNKLYNNPRYLNIDENKRAEAIEEDFIHWKLSQGNNFDIIINHHFPGASKITESYSQEMRDRMNESALRDPEKYNSDIVKAHMRHIRYDRFDSKGNIIANDGPTEYVDYNILKTQLIEAISSARVINGRTNVKSMFSEMKRQANRLKADYGTDNRTRNSILSFLETFGREYNPSMDEFKQVARRAADLPGTSKGYKLSHYMMAYHSGAIKQIISEMDIPDKAERIAAIDIKSRISNDLINAVISDMNLRKMNYITINLEFGPDGMQFNRSMFNESSESTMKRHFKGLMEMKFVSDDNVYSQDSLKRVNGTWDEDSSSVYDVSIDGVKKNARGKVLVWNNGKYDWFAKDNDGKIKDAQAMLNFFGVKARMGTVRDIFLNPEIKDQFKIGGDELANYLGHMMASVYAHPQFMDPGTIAAGNFKTRLDAFMEKNSLDINKEDPSEASFITDFFPLIDMVSSIQGYIEGKTSPNFISTVKGESRSNVKLASSLDDKFSNVSNGNASDKIKDETINKFNENKGVIVMNNAPFMLKKNGKYGYTDSLLNKDSGMSIVAVQNINGIKYFLKGTEPDEFVESDYLNVMMTNFMYGVNLGRQDQLLNFMPDALGDSGVLPSFTVSFGTKHNKLLTLSTNESGEKSASVNEDMINNHVGLMFDYHHKARLIALNKFYKLYSGKNAIKLVSQIDQNVALEDQESNLKLLQAELFHNLNGDKRNNKANINYFREELYKAGLIENRDFLIKKGKIVRGNVFDEEYEFNEANYVEFNRLQGSEKTQFRDEIFRHRLHMMANMFNQNPNYEPDSRIGDIKDRMYTREKFTKLDKKGKETKGWKYDWHPIYKSLFYGHMIVNNTISNHTIGNELQFPSITKKQKINKAFNSSGKKPIIGGSYNLPLESNIVRITDVKGSSPFLTNLFGDNVTNEEFDGHEIVNPIYALQLAHSLGGSVTSSMYSDTNIKIFHNSVDPLTHVADQNKMSQFVMNEDWLADTPGAMDLFKFVLTGGKGTQENGINLYDKFRDIQQSGIGPEETGQPLSFMDTLHKLHDFIKEQEEAGVNLHDNYISAISYESVNKSFKGGVNNVAIDALPSTKDLMIDKRDNNGIYYQLNLNHPVVGGDVARSNQFDSNLGVLKDKSTAVTVDIINSILERKNNIRIQTAIDKEGGFKEYLRKLGSQGVENVGRANILGDLYNNKKIDITLPMLYYSAFEAYVSEVNKGIDPRSKGIKAVQQPGTLALFETTDSNGNVFYATQSELKNNKWKTKDKGSVLQHYRFLDKSGKDVSQDVITKYDGDYYNDLAKINKSIRQLSQLMKQPQTESVKSQIDKLITGDAILSKDGLRGKVKSFLSDVKKNIAFMAPAQIGIEFLYRKEFGIGHAETLNQVLSIDTKDGFFNVKANLKKALGSDYYDKTKRNLAIEKMFKTIYTDFKPGEISHRGMTNEQDIATYYKSFLDALIVYGTRVPTPMLSSAFYGEIEVFTPNSGNTVYIPTSKNIFDNSDFDIDELSLYFKDVQMMGGVPTISSTTIDATTTPDINKLSENTTEDILANAKHDAIIKAFTNPDNIDMFTIPLDIQSFRDIVSEQQENSEFKYNNDIATSVNNFISAQLGKTMTGRFANGVTAIGRLMRLTTYAPELVSKLGLSDQLVKNKIPDWDFVKERTTLVITTMAKVLQISVDNAKELILGYLNINQTSGNIVTAMIMNGNNEEDLAKFLSIPVVAETIKDTAETLASNKKTREILDIIDEKIRRINENLSSDREFAIAEKVRRFKYAIEQEFNRKAKEMMMNVSIKNEYTDQWDMFDLSALRGSVYSSDIEKMLTSYKENTTQDNLSKIEDKIASLSEKLANNAEMIQAQDKEYLQYSSDQLEALSELRELHFKGEFIWRITQGFSLYRGIQNKDVLRQATIDNLQFSMNMTLNQYANGIKDGYSWIDEGRFLLGKNVSAETINGMADISGHVQAITEAIKNDKLLTPDKIEFITGSSVGYESEFAKELMKNGFTVTKYISSGSKALLENGMKTFKVDDPNYIVDEDSRSERHLRSLNSKKAKVTINLDATNLHDSVYGEHVENISANKSEKQIGDITGRLDSAVRSNKSETEKVVVNLTGSSIFNVKTKGKTEYETFIETETNIRKFGDVASIFKSLPNIDSYVKALQSIEEVQEEFYNKSPFAKKMLTDYQNMQTVARLSAKQRVAFDRSLQKFIIDMYFNKKGMTADLEDLSISPKKIGAVYDKNVDFSSYEDREYFIAEFPHAILNLQEEMHENKESPLWDKVNDRENAFIGALRFGGQKLIFDSTFLDNTSFYKQEFQKIEREMPNLAELLKLYNLLAHGFQFEYGSYRSIIGDTFYEDISGFMQSVNTNLTSNKGNKMKTQFSNYFLDNSVIMDPDLRNYYSKDTNRLQLLNDEGIYPKYVSDTDVKPRPAGTTGRKNVGYKVVKKHIGDHYETIYSNSTDKMKDIPSNRTVESDKPVVRLTDVKDFRALRSDNKYTVVSFRYPHTYTDSDVYVNGKGAKLHVEDQYKVSLRISGETYKTEEVRKRNDEAESVEFLVSNIADLTGKKMLLIRSGNYFTAESGTDALLFNPRNIHPETSTISNLYLINSSILENNNKNLYDQVADIATKLNQYDSYTTSKKVAELLRDETVIKNENDIKTIDIARRSIITSIGNAIGVPNTNTITFKSTLSDLTSLSTSNGPAFNGLLNSTKAQWDSRMAKISDLTAREIIGRLNTRFSTKTRIVTEAQARVILNRPTGDVPAGFYNNGEAFYVSGKISQDTPIHEVLHPFVESMFTGNKLLYDNILSEILKSTYGQDTKKWVSERYSDQSSADQEKELVTQVLGEQAAKIIPPARNRGLIGVLERFWNWVTDNMRSLFKKEIMASKINPNTTLGELATILSKGGNVITEKYGNLWEQRTNISPKDLVDDLLITKELTNDEGLQVQSHAQKKLENLKAYIYNEIAMTPDKSYKIYTADSGVLEFDLSKIWVAGPEASMAYIEREIVPLIDDENSTKKKALYDWLNSISERDNGFGKLDKETVKKFFGKKGSSKNMFSYDTLKGFKKLIRHSSAAVIMPYSQLSSYFEGTNLKGITDNDLMDSDPMVIIHNQLRNSQGDIESIDISILDLSFNNSDFFGNAGKGLFENYITDDVAKKMNISSINTMYEVKKLQMGFMALKMREVGGKKVNIRSVGVANIGRDMFTPKMADITRLMNMIRQVKNIPDFVGNLNPKLQSLALNEKIQNPRDYLPDYMEMLRMSLYDQLATQTENNNKNAIGTLNTNIDSLNDYLNGTGTDEELKKVLEHRRWLMENVFEINTKDKRDNSEEYWLVSEILGNLKGYKRNPLTSMPDMSNASAWTEWLSSIHDMKNTSLQDIYAVIMRSSDEVSGVFDNEFQKPHKNLVNKLDHNPVLEKLGNVGEKRFQRLFKKQQIIGTDGKMHEINMFEIHTERNAENASLNLTDDELNYANFVADLVEKYTKEMYRHDAQMNGKFFSYDEKDNRVIDTKGLDQYVEDQYNKFWKRGMLPIMPKYATEQIFEGNIGRGIKRWWDRLRNPQELLPEMLELARDNASQDIVRSHFSNQYMGVSTLGYGSTKRLEKLGLDNSSGNLIVPISTNNNGSLKNTDLSENIEEIMRFFVMDALWKPQMDTKVMPEYQGALSRLNGIEQLYNLKQTANVRHLTERMERIVLGKNQWEHESKEWKNLSTGLNLVYKMTTFNGVALSIPVAITSGVGNLTEVNLLALANEFGNPYNTFGVKHLQQAKLEVMMHANKVGAIARQYQIMDMGRFDLLNNQRWKESTNHVWDARTFHYLNWLTDYSVREIVMVAQMMHDGTYDAHSVSKEGVVSYDAKKDTRLFNRDGSVNETTNKNGALHKWIARNLSNDRRITQDPESLPVLGYDLDDQRKFKWIANKFVTGTYDHESTGKFDAFILGKLAAQFKKYLIDKSQVRLGTMKTVSEGGYKQIVVDENGKEREVWIELETQGAYITVASWMSDEIIQPLMKRDFKDLQKFKKLTELQKHNFARTTFDAAIFVGIYALFTGLAKMAPPDQEKPMYLSLMDMRLITAFKNGWMTALAFTPKELMSSLGIPVVDQVKRLINLATMNGSPSDLRRSLPLKSTIDSFTQIYDLYNK